MIRIKQKYGKLETLPEGYRANFLTEIFGKRYFWCTDPEGEWFLEPVPDDD